MAVSPRVLRRAVVYDSAPIAEGQESEPHLSRIIEGVKRVGWHSVTESDEAAAIKLLEESSVLISTGLAMSQDERGLFGLRGAAVLASAREQHMPVAMLRSGYELTFANGYSAGPLDTYIATDKPEIIPRQVAAWLGDMGMRYGVFIHDAHDC